MRWRKAAILGVGLLGGSLGKALRERGLAGEVMGFVRREATIAEAVAAGAIDRGATELAPVVAGADLVVLCTPVLQMALLASDLESLLAPGAIVTDVGSVKAAVIEAVEAPIRQAGARFVGSHPMAGSDRTGVGAAREDLFAGAVVVVTPTPASDPTAVGDVHGLWEAVGARVLRLSPEAHDQMVGRTSHLPHLVAAALAEYILGSATAGEQPRLCATGFRDTTRVASGSPEMWRDIALANRESVLAALEGFGLVLQRLRAGIEESDPLAIEAFLRSAKQRRDAWIGCGNGGRAATE